MKSAFMVPICLFVGLSIAMDAMAQRDKGLIVWSSNRHTRDAGQPPTSNRDLWVMEANDGENRVRLTDHPKNEEEPAWSPDGTQIIFTSNRDGRNDIFIIDVDKDRLGRITSETHKGGWKVAVKMNNNMRNLTNNPAKTDESPTWAANGQTIAFMSRRDGNREIYLMRSDGGGQRNLTNHPAQDREPVFSYDGKKIAFRSNRDGNDDIYIMDADGSNVERITDHPGSESQPTWSRDRKKIAFATNRDGNSEIYTIDIETKEERNVTDNPRLESGPMWSADGEDIIFAATVGGNNNQADILKIEDFETCRLCAPINLLNDEDPWGAGVGTRDTEPDWYDPAFPRAVSPDIEELTTTWGKMKLSGADQK